jgi:outer membrane protein OmpA-like peptidoglycan-associated protein
MPADSLFKPEHWTFKPDAGETMDVLGPMITKAGKHSVQIETLVSAADSDGDSQILADKRAITVRGWLINHGYVPEGTPLAGESTPSRLTSGGKPKKRNGDSVRIVIDTCK